MGSSWDIVDALRDNLVTYITANKPDANISYTVECADYDEFQLNEKIQAKRVNEYHIGIYEINPDDIVRVDTGKTINWNQGYEFSLFYKLSKNYEYDERAEKVLMNGKDLVKDWIDQLAPYTVTSNKLQTLSFVGNDRPTREKQYCYMTIQATGLRDDL